MKLRTLLVLVLLLALVGGLLWIRQHGVSARAEPSRLEAALARRLRHLALPAEARDKANPVAASASVLAEGRAHFADHCAVCHANDGSGQTEIGQGLYPKAPDMRQAATQELSDGELFYIIRNGVRFTGMPGWGEGPEAQDQGSWHLVHFIRHLPKVTAGEVEEMKKLNPRSPAEAQEEKEAEEFLKGEDGAPSSAATPASHAHHH